MPWQIQECESCLSELLTTLDVKAQARLMRDLRRLQSEGSRLREPHTRSMGDGLFELRTSHKGMIYRNIFFFHEGKVVILVSFVKKTQKTPKHYLELADTRRAAIYLKEAAVAGFAIH